MNHLRLVYVTLRFKTLEWILSQTWDMLCVTEIELLYEFNPSGIERPFS